MMRETADDLGKTIFDDKMAAMTAIRLPTKAHCLAGILTGLLVITFAAGPAAAHTGFESSSPADSEVVDEPVAEITLTFSGEATPAGEGFVVLDANGNLREPDEVSSIDDLVWVLRFDEPLVGGEIGVRWMVAAPDAHPISGSLSFTVTAEFEAPPGITPSPADTPEPVGPTSVQQADTTEQTNPASETQPVDLESFLETDEEWPSRAGVIAAGARILAVLGAVLVIGATAFAAFGLRGDTSDVGAVLSWVRRGGALVALGAIIEAATMTVTLAGAWASLLSLDELIDALWSSAGFAVALRFSGGVLAASKMILHTTSAASVGDPVMVARQLATVGAGHSAPPPGRNADEPFVYTKDNAWDHSRSRAGLLGVALVAVSFMFDGHTASEGPRWLHAITNLTHVTTAATWAGGVAMLALTIRRRKRHDRPTQALQLAMRFSVIATISLIAAGVAGLTLSFVVLDSISEAWSTPWGRLLLVKVALVAVAAAGGAYNHRIVVPALDRNPDDQPTIDRFRSVVTIEAGALIAVAVVTAFLIAASSA